MADVAKGAVLAVAAYYLGPYSTVISNILYAAGTSMIVEGVSEQLVDQNEPEAVANSLETTVRSAVGDGLICYGRTLLGGQVSFFDNTGSGNNKLHFANAYALSEPQGLEGFDGVYLDDIFIPKADIDSNGVVTSGRFKDLVKIHFYAGTDSQAADTMLEGAHSEWTTSHQGKGVCYLAVEFLRPSDDEKFREAFPNGAPRNILLVSFGEKVYDPRKDDTNGGTGTHRLGDPSTWEWSDCPPLCIGNYLIRKKSDGGMGWDTSEVAWDYIAAAANRCDETKETPDGTQKRYRLNGYLVTTAPNRANLEQMLATMDGAFDEATGRVYAGQYDAPEGTIDDNWLRGDIEEEISSDPEKIWNAIRANYRDPDSKWQKMQAVPVKDSTAITQGGGTLYSDLPLDLVDNEYDAQHLAHIRLRKRQPRMLRLQCNLRALDINRWDTWTVDLPELGSPQVYRVLDFEIEDGDDDNPAPGINLVMRREPSDTWDIALADFTSVTRANQSSWTPEIPDTPAGIEVRNTADHVNIFWQTPDNRSYDHVEVWRADTQGGTYSIIDRVTGYHAQDANVIGETNWYKLRAVNKYYGKSAFTAEFSGTPKTVADRADVTADQQTLPAYGENVNQWNTYTKASSAGDTDYALSIKVDRADGRIFFSVNGAGTAGADLNYEFEAEVRGGSVTGLTNEAINASDSWSVSGNTLSASGQIVASGEDEAYLSVTGLDKNTVIRVKILSVDQQTMVGVGDRVVQRDLPTTRITEFLVSGSDAQDFDLGLLAGNLDNIEDGATFARPLAGALDGSNNVDFGAAGVVNRLIGNVTDASIHAKEGTRGFGENIIKNPGAEDGVLAPHNPVGAGGTWSIVSGDASTSSDVLAGRYAFRYDPSGQTGTAVLQFNGGGTEKNKHVSADKDQRFVLKIAYNKRGSGDANRITLTIRYRDSDGNNLGADKKTITPSTVGFQRETVISNTPPADTAFVHSQVQISNDGISNPIGIDEVEFRRADVIDAGSGYRLGDQRNIPQIGVGNRQSTQSGQTLSVVSDTQIDVVSHTAYEGNVNVSYPSASITGLSPSTTYYFYMDDPSFDGSGSYNYTTNYDDIFKSDDRYYVGYATTEASGGGGGGFGGGGGGSETP